MPDTKNTDKEPTSTTTNPSASTTKAGAGTTRTTKTKKTSKQLPQLMIEAGSTDHLDEEIFNSFYQRARDRETEYSLIDQMAMDSLLASVVDTYVEDIIETNDTGERISVIADDPDTIKRVQTIIKQLNLNGLLQDMAYQLVKYGDVYIKMLRESDVSRADKYLTADSAVGTEEKEDRRLDEVLKQEEKLQKQQFVRLNNEEKQNKENTEGIVINEDIGVVYRKTDDKYANVIEVVKNPNELFDLTSFGKTVGFIKVPTTTNLESRSSMYNNTMAYTNYYVSTWMNPEDNVYAYSATDYLHGYLNASRTRNEEFINIYKKSEEEEKAERNRINTGKEKSDFKDEDILETYTIKRGTSLLVDCFMSWRQLSLLENSLLLSRISLSGILRVFGVETGDASEADMQAMLSKTKQAVEQKLSISVDSQISEYVNPAPIVNSLFVATRDGKGAITCTTIGQDYDPKSIIDIEYFRDKMFGALRVPKQYFGFVSDNAGFSGGESLAQISARYGKAVKKYQAILAELLTNIVNYYFIDEGDSQLVNQFSLRLQPPTMQSDTVKREQINAQITTTEALITFINSVKDDPFALKLSLAALPDEALNTNTRSLINDRIEKLENGEISDQNQGEEMPPEGMSGGLTNEMPVPAPIVSPSGETGPEEPLETSSPEETAPTETPEPVTGVEEGPSEETLNVGVDLLGGGEY